MSRNNNLPPQEPYDEVADQERNARMLMYSVMPEAPKPHVQAEFNKESDDIVDVFKRRTGPAMTEEQEQQRVANKLLRDQTEPVAKEKKSAQQAFNDWVNDPSRTFSKQSRESRGKAPKALSEEQEQALGANKLHFSMNTFRGMRDQARANQAETTQTAAPVTAQSAPTTAQAAPTTAQAAPVVVSPKAAEAAPVAAAEQAAAEATSADKSQSAKQIDERRKKALDRAAARRAAAKAPEVAQPAEAASEPAAEAAPESVSAPAKPELTPDPIVAEAAGEAVVTGSVEQVPAEPAAEAAKQAGMTAQVEKINQYFADRTPSPRQLAQAIYVREQISAQADGTYAHASGEMVDADTYRELVDNTDLTNWILSPEARSEALQDAIAESLDKATEKFQTLVNNRYESETDRLRAFKHLQAEQRHAVILSDTLERAIVAVEKRRAAGKAFGNNESLLIARELVEQDRARQAAENSVESAA